MKRVISIFLIVLLCIMCTIPAYAEQLLMPTGEASIELHRTENEYCCPDGLVWSLISDAYYDMDSFSSGNIVFELMVEAKKIVEKLGFTNLHLQVWNGYKWSNVSTWRDNYLTYRDFFTFGKTVNNLTSGRYYRLQARAFYAENGSDYQLLELTTPYIQCR